MTADEALLAIAGRFASAVMPEEGTEHQTACASARDVPALISALRAVLAMHQPQQIAVSDSTDVQHATTYVTRCSCQPAWRGYPCPTVVAIESALGGAS